MTTFSQISTSSNRKIVIHHTHLIDDIVGLLQHNDLVFFDDCLYSQYLFLKENACYLKEMSVNCVLGLSTSIVCTDQTRIPAESSAILHDRVHSGDMTALGGFMTIDEVKELLGEHSNIYLAGHGDNHLQLEKIEGKLNQLMLFKKDVSHCREKLMQFGFKTDIFVFPYAYDSFPLSHRVVSDNSFHYLYAGVNSLRTPIEELAK